MVVRAEDVPVAVVMAAEVMAAVPMVEVGRAAEEREAGERVVVELVMGECMVATEADTLAAPAEELLAVARFRGPPAGSSYQRCTYCRCQWWWCSSCCDSGWSCLESAGNR